MKHHAKQLLALCLSLAILLCLACGCGKKVDTINKNLDLETPVTLRVAGPWQDFKALELVSKAFQEKYHNCTIEYEFVQDYYESMAKRLEGGQDPVDLMLTTNVQAEAPLLPYAADLYSIPEMDLSQTFEGLIRNFEYRDAPADTKVLYAVPLGAEMRGMFVNKTLLDSLSLPVPTTLTQLLEDCRVLSENGYIPLHGNPGYFGQQLMYPYICNLIANAEDYEATYNAVANREPGISRLFAQPMALLYDFMAEGYYNYKYVETELGLFTDITSEALARDFLNVAGEENSYEKLDDVGRVAFMPAVMSLGSTIAQTKEDYHSEIEYEFILSPLTDEGGFAYLSPAHGLALSRSSTHVDWAVEFLNFLFQPEIAEMFAETFNVIPNTGNAFSLITDQFDIAENHISHLGQVTFSYDFYNKINTSLVEVAKGNNPKYRQEDGTLFPLDYYMNNLEQHLMEE